MTPARIVVLELSRIEAAHLAGLVTQFSELLDESPAGRPDDPAIERLVPDAYQGDPAAAREFRDLTQRELLDRRAMDASTVLATLAEASVIPETDDADEAARESALTEAAVISLDPEELAAWLRTLAAIRLVLASRLGIVEEDDHDDDDPRYGIYDWLGFRLDGLVRAAENES